MKGIIDMNETSKSRFPVYFLLAALFATLTVTFIISEFLLPAQAQVPSSVTPPTSSVEDVIKKTDAAATDFAKNPGWATYMAEYQAPTHAVLTVTPNNPQDLPDRAVVGDPFALVGWPTDTPTWEAIDWDNATPYLADDTGMPQGPLPDGDGGTLGLGFDASGCKPQQPLCIVEALLIHQMNVKLSWCKRRGISNNVHLVDGEWQCKLPDRWEDPEDFQRDLEAHNCRPGSGQTATCPTSTPVPTATRTGPLPGRRDHHQLESARRARALRECYPGGEGLSNEIRDGEARRQNMHDKKLEFQRRFGSPCQCHGVCVH